MNKNVIITRPLIQAKELEKVFLKNNLQPIYLPTFSIIPNNNILLHQIIRKETIDWVIFTSVNAVNCFFSAIQSFSKRIKLAAIGRSTAKRIEEFNCICDFIPSQAYFKILIKELPVEKNARILYLHSQKSNNRVEDVFKNGQSLIVYNLKPVYYKKKYLESIIKKSDYILFYSGSAVNYFCNYQVKFLSLKIVAIGKSTAKILLEKNIKVDLILEKPEINLFIQSVNKNEI